MVEPDLFDEQKRRALRARGWLPHTSPPGSIKTDWWRRPDGAQFTEPEAFKQLQRLISEEAKREGD